MYIQKRQYLSLLQQVAFLKEQIQYLKKDNTILADELIRERQLRTHLQKMHQQNTVLIEKLNQKALAHQSQNTASITTKIVQISKETKQLIHNKFDHLEKTSLVDIKKLQLKNMKTQIDYFELHQFVQKIRKIYHDSLDNQNVKSKKLPSLIELVKWIKSLPGVTVNNNQKSLLNTASSVGNLKKQTYKSSKKKQKEIEKSLISKISQSKYLSFADYPKENIQIKN